MYLIVTRAFPPELGGMQSLMWGLTKEMSKNFKENRIEITQSIQER